MQRTTALRARSSHAFHRDFRARSALHFDFAKEGVVGLLPWHGRPRSTTRLRFELLTDMIEPEDLFLNLIRICGRLEIPSRTPGLLSQVYRAMLRALARLFGPDKRRPREPGGHCSSRAKDADVRTFKKRNRPLSRDRKTKGAKNGSPYASFGDNWNVFLLSPPCSRLQLRSLRRDGDGCSHS